MRSLLFLIFGASFVSAQFSIKSVDGTVTLRKNNELVTQYRTDSKVPYLYPISAPSGTNLSRHWPMDQDAAGEETDHPHHRSFWLSHGSVNGYDFWAWTGNKDARIVHQSTGTVNAQGNKASFSVKLAWQGDKKTILEESRQYSIEDIDEATRVIDVSSTLKAVAGDVVFGDTKEGFCAFRVDRTLRLKGPTAKGGIMDSHGRKNAECWGKKSAYVAFHGPDDQGKPAVITMMDHPSNLRHETWWHARDYGLLAANPFGIHDFEGKKDKTLGNHTLKDQQVLTFRYRLVLHRGEVDDAKIANWWKSYSQS
ncbi:MAG: hypothetical protein RI957_686 [Verrucomicrobiota bacterium]|jgi:hypothetical protein